jgi:hypothetical protein
MSTGYRVNGVEDRDVFFFPKKVIQAVRQINMIVWLGVEEIG